MAYWSKTTKMLSCLFVSVVIVQGGLQHGEKIASKLKSCGESFLLLENEDNIRRNLFDLLQASGV